MKLKILVGLLCFLIGWNIARFIDYCNNNIDMNMIEEDNLHGKE